MLAPEVWNLQTKKNSVIVNSGCFDQNAKAKVERVIVNHPFNQMVSIILPNCDTVPESIVNILKDSDYYRVDNLNLEVFLSRDFVEGFVKRGKFTALSWNPRNDIDACYAVTPDGKLILSIHKELYQSLGLEGRRSAESDSKNIINIDLRNIDLLPGKSYYERVKQALSHEQFRGVSMQFYWDPPDATICPSSAAKYFNDLNFTVNVCNAKIKSYTERALKCPKFLPTDRNEIDRPHELIEYIGMHMLSCDQEENEFLNSYSEFHDCDEISEAKFVHCKGLFTIEFVRRLSKELRQVDGQPWIGICVQGFEHAHVSFFNKEHRFTSNGDNNYTILFYPNNQFFLYQNSSAWSK